MLAEKMGMRRQRGQARILFLQPKAGNAKRYQVKRVRDLFLKYQKHPGRIVITALALVTSAVATNHAQAQRPQRSPRFVSAEQQQARRAAKIVIPRIELREATLAQALDFLRNESRIHDPQHQGVQLRVGPEVAAGFRGRGSSRLWRPLEEKITVALINVSLTEALRDVTALAGCRYVPTVTGFQIVFPEMSRERLETLTIPLPSALFGESAFPEEVGADKAVIARMRADFRQYFVDCGVIFQRDAKCSFDEGKIELIVINTAAQLDHVEVILESLIPPEIPGPEVPKWSDPASEMRTRCQHLIIGEIVLYDCTVPEAASQLSESAKQWDRSNTGLDRGVHVAVSEYYRDAPSIPGLEPLPGRPIKPWFAHREVSEQVILNVGIRHFWKSQEIERVSAENFPLAEPGPAGVDAERQIRYAARSVSLLQAASEVAKQAGGQLEIKKTELVISARKEPQLVARECLFPPNFLETLEPRKNDSPEAARAWQLFLGEPSVFDRDFIYAPQVVVRDVPDRQKEREQLIEKSWREYYGSEE